MRKVFSNPLAIITFLGPAFLLYAFIMLIPIGWALGYTFVDAFWFGLKYAFVVTSGQVGFGLILSLVYIFYLKGGSSWVRTLIFFPVVLPTVAVAQIFSKLVAIAPQYGLVNAFLTGIGQEALVQAWLGQGSTAFWVIVIMDIWRAMGFYALLLYAGVVEVPAELIEAAKIDGATDFQASRYIVIPLLRPVLISAIVFSLNGTLKVFDTILALTNGGPGTATSPLTIYFQKVAFAFGQYGYGSTIAVFLTIECLLVTLLVLVFNRRAID
jgi:raffinose/stachyose/melibiose transport system permease protein